MVDFPNSPTDGEIHAEGNSVWVYRDPPGAWQVLSQGGVPIPIVEAMLSGNDGWQVWGDTLIQWGAVAGSDQGPLTVTFAQPFKTGVSPRIQTTVNTVLAHTRVSGAINQTNTQFETYCRLVSDGAFTSNIIMWLAIGEAPDELKKAKTVQAAGGMPLADLITALQPTFGRYGERTAVNLPTSSNQASYANVIPEWANHVELAISLMSGSVVGSMNFRARTASGDVTTGYVAVVHANLPDDTNAVRRGTQEASFGWGVPAASQWTGTVKLTRYAANIWLITGQGFDGADNNYQLAGRMSLAEPLTGFTLYTGSGNITGGGVGLRYWE